MKNDDYALLDFSSNRFFKESVDIVCHTFSISLMLLEKKKLVKGKNIKISLSAWGCIAALEQKLDKGTQLIIFQNHVISNRFKKTLNPTHEYSFFSINTLIKSCFPFLCIDSSNFCQNNHKYFFNCQSEAVKLN